MAARGDEAAGRLDAFRLARDRGVLEGSVDPHRLERVADLIADGDAAVSWQISGTADVAGRPALTVQLRGSVALTCQRCLDDFDWPIDQRTELLLARDERELAELDAENNAEVVMAATPLSPLALVEDELLLALPFAPRHADDQTCTTG